MKGFFHDRVSHPKSAFVGAVADRGLNLQFKGYSSTSERMDRRLAAMQAATPALKEYS